jgi:type II secretory pathway pseudopilin PulG
MVAKLLNPGGDVVSVPIRPAGPGTCEVGLGRRAGFTLIEVAGATVLLATAMVIAVQVLSLSTAQARDAERRQLAVQVAANIMERLTSAPWETLDADLAAAQTLPDESVSRLPSGELKVTIAADTGQPRAKRITVNIQYKNRAGEFLTPVRLTAWSFAPEGANE